MNHSNNDGDGDYNNVDTEPDSTPFPPTISCIAAMGIALIIMLMCIIFSTVSIVVFIFFCITMMLLIEYWFRGGDDLEMEHMGDFDLVDGDVEEKDDDDEAVTFLEAFFSAVKGKKVVRITIECFGSEEIVELGYSDCSICMDDFQKGEKCLVFPSCGHIFHCKCIARWLKKKKLTCPVCRSHIAANAIGTGGFRRSSPPPSWWVEP